MVWQESNGTDDTIPTITVLMRSVEAQTAPLLIFPAPAS